MMKVLADLRAEDLKIRKDFLMILMHAWSVRLIVFFAVVEIGYDITPAFQDAVPLRYYVPVRVLFVLATIWARITKQPGFDP